MIFFDVTKAADQRHHSGLTRMSLRLREEMRAALPGGVVGVVWHARRERFVREEKGDAVVMTREDWWITPEQFAPEERPGFAAWRERGECRTAAVFADAIPLTHPGIVWPRSVARFPHYMRMLADFDRVLGISAASAREVGDYLAWLGGRRPPVVALTLGAEGHRRPRVTVAPRRAASRAVLAIGILEPRKNQAALLDAAETLWAEGLAFRLDLVGRVNPHFGRPLEKRIRELRKAGRPVAHHDGVGDAAVEALLAGARLLAMPSIAEGCGLPVLEALWSGLPVIASDLPSIVESAAGGGCALVPRGDTGALAAALRYWLTDDAAVTAAAEAAGRRELPTWAGTARGVIEALAAP